MPPGAALAPVLRWRHAAHRLRHKGRPHAAEAVVSCNELQDTRAGAIIIRDHSGIEFTIEQLTLAAQSPKLKLDRDPGFSG
jgi:hypothetical protein